MYSVVNFPI